MAFPHQQPRVCDIGQVYAESPRLGAAELQAARKKSCLATGEEEVSVGSRSSAPVAGELGGREW